MIDVFLRIFSICRQFWSSLPAAACVVQIVLDGIDTMSSPNVDRRPVHSIQLCPMWNPHCDVRVIGSMMCYVAKRCFAKMKARC
jgi:hypothetical protein